MIMGAKANYVAGGGNPPEIRPGVITHEYPTGVDGDQYADVQIDQSVTERQAGKAVETFSHVLRSENHTQPNTFHLP